MSMIVSRMPSPEHVSYVKPHFTENMNKYERNTALFFSDISKNPVC